MAACLLVHEGASAEEALQAVKRARGPRSPETTQQHDFVRDYEQWLRGRTAGGDRAQSREAALQVLERHGGGFTPPRPPTAGRVTDTREDAIAGAVLGAAIGDAMGAPTEFLSMEAIRGRFGHSGVQGFVEYREVNGQRVALYTDDTQMAEAVALGLLEARDARGDLDVTMTSIARRFVAWAEHPQGGHRAPGNACLSGCRALAAGIPWREAGGPKAGGCGSVMRAYPFGLLFHADLDRAEAWSVEHSKLTHRDPIALAACAAMTVGMALVIREKRPGEVTAAMVAAAARHDGKTAAMMRQAVEEARAGIGPEVTLDRLRAWAAHEAIAAAVYIVERHPEDARSAILEGANTPGDSDSIATLAGALVGGRVGLAGLPEEWVRDVERSDELRALARRVGVDGVGW
jgi:ADP-ribosylglycohydrolase